MTLLSRFAVQTIGHRRLVTEDMGEGATYNPPIDQDATAIQAVYDPVESDLGPDNPASRTGTVLTEAQIKLGDVILPAPAPNSDDNQPQTVTQVIPRFHRSGTLEYYEVTL